jgi:hypothetical protein
MCDKGSENADEPPVAFLSILEDEDGSNQTTGRVARRPSRISSDFVDQSFNAHEECQDPAYRSINFLRNVMDGRIRLQDLNEELETPKDPTPAEANKRIIDSMERNSGDRPENQAVARVRRASKEIILINPKAIDEEIDEPTFGKQTELGLEKKPLHILDQPVTPPAVMSNGQVQALSGFRGEEDSNMPQAFSSYVGRRRHTTPATLPSHLASLDKAAAGGIEHITDINTLKAMRAKLTAAEGDNVVDASDIDGFEQVGRSQIGAVAPLSTAKKTTSKLTSTTITAASNRAVAVGGNSRTVAHGYSYIPPSASGASTDDEIAAVAAEAAAKLDAPNHPVSHSISICSSGNGKERRRASASAVVSSTFGGLSALFGMQNRQAAVLDERVVHAVGSAFATDPQVRTDIPGSQDKFPASQDKPPAPVRISSATGKSIASKWGKGGVIREDDDGV